MGRGIGRWGGVESGGEGYRVMGRSMGR